LIGMAPRTLSSTWRQFEKLARAIADSRQPASRLLKDLEDLSGKANRSKVVEALQALFVADHPGVDGVRVQFVGGQQAVEQVEPTRYDGTEKVILVSPVGVVRFIDECGECVEQMKTREARESFRRYRLCAYQAELSKLPSHLVLFLALLRQVADISDVTRSDRRGSNGAAAEPEEDRPYLMLLWAFKQLEAVLRDVKGVNLRAEYRILWYESDWVTGRR
jgi:hypothetical protein